jgi:putative oxidoreductase
VDGSDIASLLLRVVVGGTLVAHGWNHVWGGGRLAGTARWFDSIGIRPGRVHATLASVTELGGGALLVLGLLTPLAAAAAVGTMGVALVANHLRNGFFIFRPGEGYEYVLMIIVVAAAIGALGGRALSLDDLLGLDDDLDGTLGLALAVGLGGGGAALLLGACWRPTPSGGGPGA